MPDNQDIGGVVEKIDGIANKLDNFATKGDVDKSIGEIKAEVAALKTPKVYAEPNRFSTLKAFKSHESAYKFGQWMIGVCGKMFPQTQTAPAYTKACDWLDRNGMNIAKAQGENVDTAGGFLVPAGMLNEIIDLREQYGVFRANARIVPMSSDTLTIPRRSGGLTTYWPDENGSITASQKSWDLVRLTARKLAALVLWSTEVAEDAIVSMADDLARELAWQFSYTEDLCGFIGDGTSTYGGIHGAAVKINDGNHAASIMGAASTHTGFETLTLSDFHGAVGKLPLYARGNAKWYVSAAGFALSMERLAHAAGGNTVQTTAGGMAPAFLGYPVVISQVLNSTAGADASKIKCLFGDLRLAAKMGVRREISIATSDQRYFEYDQLAIRATQRFDINIHDLGDGSTAGPLVALKSAAS